MGISKSQRRRERNPKWVIYRAGANAELGIPGVPVAHRVDLNNPRNTGSLQKTECSVRLALFDRGNGEKSSAVWLQPAAIGAASAS